MFLSNILFDVFDKFGNMWDKCQARFLLLLQFKLFAFERYGVLRLQSLQNCTTYFTNFSVSVCVGVRNIKTNQLQNGQFIDFESHQEFYHFKDHRWRSLGLYKKNSPSHGDVSETKLVFTVIWQIYLILRSLWKLILFINHRFCRFIPSLFFFNKNGPITTHPDFTWPSCVRLDVAVWTIFLCVRFWRRYNEIT
jgi:hypothetical protein